MQKCDPHRGRKQFFKKRVKMIASAGKRATKVGVGKWWGDKVAKMTHVGGESG